MSSLSHQVGSSYSELCDFRGECLHIAASKYIIEELDAVHMIYPSLDFAGKFINFVTCTSIIISYRPYLLYSTFREPPDI